MVNKTLVRLCDKAAKAEQSKPRRNARKLAKSNSVNAATSNLQTEKAMQVRMQDLNAASVANKQRKESRGPISRQESYPVDEFMRRAGLTVHAYRKARRQGLKVKKIGDTAWITGEEWFRWLESSAKSDISD